MPITVLVTGAKGFLGSALVKELSPMYNVIGVDIETDLTVKENVNALPDVDAIFHLAALNNTSKFYEQPWSVLTNGILPALHLTDRYRGVPTVYFSSSEAYAGGVNIDVVNTPTDENVPLVIDDISNTRWSYASAKIAMESLAHSASTEHGTNFQIIRPHNVYGPNQKGHFIPEFLDRAIKGEYYIKGNDIRSYCYVTDAAKAIVHLFENGNWNETYNIGNDAEPMCAALVASKAMNIMGLAEVLDVHAGVAGSVSERVPDLTKLYNTGFKNTVTMTDGLTNILRENYGFTNK